MSSKFCSNCGASIDVDTKFCSTCGAVQKSVSSVNTPAPYAQNYTYANVPVGYSTPKPQVSEIKILAIIEVGAGAFILFSMLALFGFLTYSLNRYSANNPTSTSTENLGPILALLFALGAFVLIYAICAIIFGIGLYRFRNWGRIGSMVIGALSLVSFPLGTLYGGIMIYLLTKQENKVLFNQTKNS